MSHPSVEILSTYLDRELTKGELQRLADHLEHCDACRGRLQSLDRVSRRLQKLGRQAPPAHLGLELRAVTASRAVPETLRGRLEGSVGRSITQSSILALFGVVVALLSILYLLSSALSYRHSATQRLEPAAGSMTIETTREAAGRIFDRRGDLWIERGLETVAPAQRLRSEDPEVLRWFETEPGFGEIGNLEGRVRLRVEGRVVEISFGESP